MGSQMSEEKLFTNDIGEDYLILKAEEATLWDVFKAILPGSRNMKNLVDFPVSKEQSYTSFRSRLNICSSILLLKLFAVNDTPLKILRTSIFRSRSTHGRRFRGRVRRDDDDWKIIELHGTKNLDDDNDFRYYGSLTIMASKLAYEEESLVREIVNDQWKMNLLGCRTYYNDFQNTPATHAFMFKNTAKDPNVTVVAFRGTDPLDAKDWIVDLNFSWYKIEGIGNIHCGFLKALGLQKAKGDFFPKELPKSKHKFAYYTIRQMLRDIVEADPNAKFIITGHSLGGALATLFVTLLAHHKESAILKRLQAVYTYGQPRVGDIKFAEFMENTLNNKEYKFKYYRFVYSCDMVSRLPLDFIMSNYKHFGGCVYFNCFYNGEFLPHPPYKNYFTIIWLIPMYLSSCWELIRSLIITPLLKGRAHFEGFYGIFLRLVGLVIPGLSAHVCPNYVNLIRWGKLKNVPEHKKLVINEGQSSFHPAEVRSTNIDKNFSDQNVQTSWLVSKLQLLKRRFSTAETT